MYDVPSIDNIVDPRNDYKSKAEIKVANILRRNYEQVEYEKPLFLTDRGRERIWYPDFTVCTPYIDDLIVEYAGLMQYEEYAQGIRHKANTYSRNDLQAVFLYPEEVFGKDYEQKIIYKILEAAVRLYDYWDNPPATARKCRKKKPDFSI